MTESEKIQFNPPYTLVGTVSISFCVLRSSENFPLPELDGYTNLKTLRLGTWIPVMVVSSHWEPHPLHPVPYNEMIMSIFGYYRWRPYSVPIALYLDDPFHVDLGRKYYHLPKYLVPDLVVKKCREFLTVQSEKNDIYLSGIASILQILFWPFSILLSLAVIIGTTLIPLLGVSEKPFIKSHINLHPRWWSGKFARATAFDTQYNGKITSLINIIWTQTTSKIGRPKTL